MSEYLEITGPTHISGSVRVQGAKNAALPLLIASLLTAEKVSFSNVPNLEDVNLTVHLLKMFGASVSREPGKVTIHVPRLVATEASYSLVKALRASFWVLGPLLVRGRAARVALPGGDIIGARPVDLHLSALTMMGADIKVKHGVVYATAPHGLKPANIKLRFPSVGATHQILMAAALTRGVTVIEGAAREPEVSALVDLLSGMGAYIEGKGTSTLIIHGKDELGGTSCHLIGDRIVAGTYLAAGAIAGGSVRVEGVNPEHLSVYPELLSEAGCGITTGEDWIELTKTTDRLKAIKTATGPFPGLATDLQAALMAVLCTAEGTSVLEENIFEGRFGIVSEFCRMGAQIAVDDRKAIITGVPQLSGAPVDGLDLRAAASLSIAALAADGVTLVHDIHHLRRGYSSFEANLTALGGRVVSRIENHEDFLFAGC
jgi:UDP-N-acetylglucosamine 1-carboxyvinyltransferase